MLTTAHSGHHASSCVLHWLKLLEINNMCVYELWQHEWHNTSSWNSRYKKTDILRLFFNYWFLSNWLIFHDYGLGLVPQWSPVKPLCTAGTWYFTVGCRFSHLTNQQCQLSPDWSKYIVNRYLSRTFNSTSQQQWHNARIKDTLYNKLGSLCKAAKDDYSLNLKFNGDGVTRDQFQ